MKIVVFGDSHIPARASHLPRELIRYIDEKQIDLLITTGDLTDYSILENLPVGRIVSIRGNMDFGNIPVEAILPIYGFTFYITHGHIVGRGNYSKLVQIAKMKNANVVVTGHTHEPSIFIQDGILVLNPGTITGAYGGIFPIHDLTFLYLEILEKSILVTLFKIENGLHVKQKSQFCIADKIMREC